MFALLWHCAPTASATLVDSETQIATLSGGFNQAMPSGSDLDLSQGSAVNDPTGQIVGGAYLSNLTLHMLGSASTTSGDVTTITGFSVDSLEISIPTATTPDTITFSFQKSEWESDDSAAVAFGPPPPNQFTFYLGVLQATIGTAESVVNTGPDKTALTNDLSDFINLGGNLFLNYNGINIGTSGASLTAAPSESFTLVANVSSPLVPEPSTAILSLSGAVAIILGKLAHQLRRTIFNVSWTNRPTREWSACRQIVERRHNDGFGADGSGGGHTAHLP